jgi:uncharacterized membrane protein (UPF0127 family)
VTSKAPSFLKPLVMRPPRPSHLVNTRTNAVLATELEPAFDSASRKRGLLGRDSLAAGAALLIAPCSSIHTFFMRFPIDVIFVDRTGRVLKTCATVPARRIAWAWGGFVAIELAAGALAAHDVRPGDILAVHPLL